MGAPSKRARKIRAAGEFDTVRIAATLRPPRNIGNGRPWSLGEIFAARDSQMAGRFLLPVRMAESMRTDDALYTAYENRLAPQKCIPVKLEPANQTAKALSICAEGEALFGQNGVGVHPDALADIHGYLVNHGIAIGVNVTTPRADGSRVDFEHKCWPLEFVRWDITDRCLKTLIDPQGQRPFIGGPGYQSTNTNEEPIQHGDGRWTIYRKHELTPWNQEACVLPAAIVWARHAFANRDWAKGSVSIGNAKVIGELPENIALQGPDGALTPDALAFLELLKAIASVDTPVGIKPFGSGVAYLTNTSSAWEVWAKLVENAEKAAARIYLGTDGVLGSQGGAPGVDIGALFGVAETKVEGDLKALERGILTGVIEPWCAINFGDSSLAPRRCYQIPDDSKKAKHAELGTRTKAFVDSLSSIHTSGITLTPAYVTGLACDFGVRDPALSAPVAGAPPKAAGAPPSGSPGTAPATATLRSKKKSLSVLPSRTPVRLRLQPSAYLK